MVLFDTTDQETAIGVDRLLNWGVLVQKVTLFTPFNVSDLKSTWRRIPDVLLTFMNVLGLCC